MDTVRAALHTIASDRPDYSQPRPEPAWGDPQPPVAVRYVENGDTRHCLVAQILMHLGYPSDVLKELDREYPVGELLTPGVPISHSQHPALGKIEPVALALLQFIQDKQADQYPWGDIEAAAFDPARFLPGFIDNKRRPWLHLNSG